VSAFLVVCPNCGAAAGACGCRERVQRVRHSALCGVCGRVFDLLDTVQASEWYGGHDCEAI